MSNDYEYMFKFIIVGDTGVGKSCMLSQFLENRFQPMHNVTIGAEYGARIVTVSGRPVKLQIWDTAGQEKFRSITRCFYRGAAGVLLVYDITSRQTFDHLAYWLEQVRSHVNPGTTIMLVGHKCDIDARARKVSREEGEEFAKENKVLFLEASAKSYENVDESFVKTAAKIVENVKGGKVEGSSEFSGIEIGNYRPPATRVYNSFGVVQIDRCCS